MHCGKSANSGKGALSNSLGFLVKFQSVLNGEFIAIENIANICLWGVVFREEWMEKMLSPKSKVGRGRSDWFTSKVFLDHRGMISAENFVVEIANSCL